MRTGDFVEALLRDSQDVNEYAFALGALGHYAADSSGHPLGVNRAVPLMYPKLARKFGSTVTYEQSPTSHVLVEFSFDVVQVAAGAYAPEAYHSYIGFKVSKAALERAFSEVYGLEMKDVFLSEDLAIASYRHAVGTTIPGMTKVAWSKKREEILKVSPGRQRETFVFHLTRREYDRQFGADYAKPHGFARFLGFIYRLIPKIGPFRSLRFSVPTPEAERLFLQSFTATREHFRDLLVESRDAEWHLPDVDLDTGQTASYGEYALADATYEELLDTLADHRFTDVPVALARNVAAFYGVAGPSPGRTARQRQRATRTRAALTSLQAVCDCR